MISYCTVRKIFSRKVVSVVHISHLVVAILLGRYPFRLEDEDDRRFEMQKNRMKRHVFGVVETASSIFLASKGKSNSSTKEY